MHGWFSFVACQLFIVGATTHCCHLSQLVSRANMFTQLSCFSVGLPCRLSRNEVEELQTYRHGRQKVQECILVVSATLYRWWHYPLLSSFSVSLSGKYVYSALLLLSWPALQITRNEVEELQTYHQKSGLIYSRQGFKLTTHCCHLSQLVSRANMFTQLFCFSVGLPCRLPRNNEEELQTYHQGRQKVHKRILVIVGGTTNCCHLSQLVSQANMFTQLSCFSVGLPCRLPGPRWKNCRLTTKNLYEQTGKSN